MNNIITKIELNELCELRSNHLRRGIGAIKDIDRYGDLLRRASEFILKLPTEEAIVMEALYLHGRSVIWVSMSLHYSDRQIRRIRKRVLDKMK